MHVRNITAFLVVASAVLAVDFQSSRAVGSEVTRPHKSIAEFTPEELLDHGPPTDKSIRLLDLEDAAVRENTTIQRATNHVDAVALKWKREGVDVNLKLETANEATPLKEESTSDAKDRWKYSLARKEVLVAKKQRDIEVIRVRNDVRTVYFDLLLTDSQISIGEELIDVEKRLLQAAGESNPEAAGSDFDASPERDAEKSAADMLQKARNRHAMLWSRLTVLKATINEDKPKSVSGTINIVPQEINAYRASYAIVEGSPETAVARVRSEVAILRYRIAHEALSTAESSPNNRQVSIDGVVSAERELQETTQRLRALFAEVYARYQRAQREMERLARQLSREAMVAAVSHSHERARSQALRTAQHRLLSRWEYLEATREFTHAVVLLNGYLLSGGFKSTPQQ